MAAANATSQPGVTLALDIGSVRIGVARASNVARLAQPLTTLANDDRILTAISSLISKEGATRLVIGLPRGLDGQETAQTTATRQFVEQLALTVTIPIIYQDEALTSHKAELELQARGRQYAKGDIDALAACYILEDYLATDHHDKL